MANKHFDIISPREAYAAYMLGSVLVDVRTSSETEKKAINLKSLKKIPFEELEQRVAELPANRKVVFFSRLGVKGQEAAKILSKYGFEDVAMVDGGFTAWEEAGLPVSQGIN
jgi:rhodanese-related sulfurtransferase